MSNLIDEALGVAARAARRAFCTPWYIAKNLPPVGPAGVAGEIAEVLWGAVCQGPFPPTPGTPTTNPPPFTGGQCPLVPYRVLAADGNTPIVYTSTPPGFRPILGPVEIRLPESGTPPNRTLTIQVRHSLSNGQRTDWISLGSSVTPPFRFVGVERIDGLPDDCGDPVPEPGPPVPFPPFPPPLPPETRPVIPDGDQPGGDFIFSPEAGDVYIDIDGALNIPVVVNVEGPNFGPINIPVGVKLPDFAPTFAPTVVIGGGGGGGGGGTGGGPSGTAPQPQPPRQICCDPIPVVGPEVAVEDPVPENPAPPGRRLVGVIVRSVIANGTQNATEVGQGGGELNLFVPRLANVYFTVAAENSGGAPVVSSTTAVPVQLLRQYIQAPESVTVRGWRVVAEPGVSTTVTPVYVPTNRR